MTVVRLTVEDDAVARIAAIAAIGTPGVARLQPQLSGLLAGAARDLAGHRRTDGATVPPAADPAAVQVERGEGEDRPVVGVTVRVVMSGTPPIREVAEDLHERVGAELRTALGSPVRTTVLVVDLQPSD